jgi:hypothetical protein
MYSTKCTRIVQFDWFDFWCFNATFNNISVISWRSVLLMEETGVDCTTYTKQMLLFNVWVALNTIPIPYHTLKSNICFVYVVQSTPVSSINKTDRHDIAEMLLNLALNTIPITYHTFQQHFSYIMAVSFFDGGNRSRMDSMHKTNVTF